ncbi:MAG: N-acetylmuramoyl-L-alanine amidase [Candidatus Binatia bacterium]
MHPQSQKILRIVFSLILGLLHYSDLGWARSGQDLSPAWKVSRKLQEIRKVVGGPKKPDRSLVTRIRHISSRSYTRVIMDLSTKVQYETHILRQDTSKGLPPRIYVDLLGARLASNVTQRIVVQDRLLRRVRVGQFSPDVVRVVLDMKSLRGHKAFLLLDPYRLVIDIQRRRNGKKAVAAENGKRSPPRKKGKAELTRIRKIVLDPGHGGKDPGAIGPTGIMEKDVVLSIAKKLAKKLKSKMGVEVILTRQDDSYVPLEERTAIANAENADLFISLHTNANPNRRMRGIESYYLDHTTDEATIRLAARENGTSRRSISDLQFILSDLTQSSKLEDSIGLAHHLHSSLVSHMRRGYRRAKDLGVKKGLFYVLVGARMPSVLLEIFFVTNRFEGRALARRTFQKKIVEALYRGIRKYRQSTGLVKNL